MKRWLPPLGLVAVAAVVAWTLWALVPGPRGPAEDGARAAQEEPEAFLFVPLLGKDMLVEDFHTPYPTPTRKPTPAPPTTDPEARIPLNAIGGSGATGEARLWDRAEGLYLELHVQGLGEGAYPAAIYRAASCDELLWPDTRLSPVVDGRSRDLLERRRILDISDQQHAIVVLDAQDRERPVSCGHVPGLASTADLEAPLRDPGGLRTGSALFWELLGRRVEVQVVLRDPLPGPRPAAIHDGDCEEIGDLRIPLEDLRGGRSATTLEDVYLETVVDGESALVLRVSADDPTILACGDLRYDVDECARVNCGRPDRCTPGPPPSPTPDPCPACPTPDPRDHCCPCIPR